MNLLYEVSFHFFYGGMCPVIERADGVHAVLYKYLGNMTVY